MGSQEKRFLAAWSGSLAIPIKWTRNSARHFGVWQSLTVRITTFERPTHFADVMLRGAFRRMEHHHYFEGSSNGTTMRDLFAYESPFGVFGRMADMLFLERYMRSFMVGRNRIIKATAESEAWRQYLRAC